jgi:hypothetical protein
VIQPKKLNEPGGGEHCRVKTSSMLAALKNLDADVSINRAQEDIRESIKLVSQRESSLLLI